MPFSSTALIGAKLPAVDTVADVVAMGGQPPHRIGTQVWGDDGKLYVYAKANASISASTAVCTVNATTFLATASGGSYTSPATAMVSGDYGWFSKASV
jgi:hypothetical protein